MLDQKLVLFDAQAFTNTNVLSSILYLADIENLGPGHQKYIHVFVDTGFTEDSSGEYFALDLVASSGAEPATSNKIVGIIKSTAVSSGSVLLTQGLIEKYAIPHKQLEGLDYVAIAGLVTSALAAGKITAYISVD